MSSRGKLSRPTDGTIKRMILWGGGSATMVAAVVLAWLVLTPAPRPSVVVKLDSVPSGASVFSGNTFFAVAPVEIRLDPGETRAFRLVKRDFADGFVSVCAGDFILSVFSRRCWTRRRLLMRTLRVPLTPLLASALTVTSDPSGAAVYVDGNRLGATPLFAERLPPGRHALCLDRADCYCDTFETVLKPGEESTVHRKLCSKVPVLYRELLAKEPGSLFRHTELIQYYVVDGDYENAIVLLRDGFEALKRADASDQEEYFWMLEKIYGRWFEYPEEGDMANLRGLCRELITRARSERVWDIAIIQKHVDAMDDYDRIHRRR